ncbi:hypothetical protein [Mycolicibacterium arseniciresistens]|uniref:Uncharacterized protein n=1 Tax=Mycolicibacterium arseniciresistens TaxID=3062257 RepID=A0ABT8UJU8_9MYCO|nr:hypothetical protein [Mycolicibacterium arseniciresistens]MDO3638046.1 hypothetical protein [Mycolicibacterium arseniciresistens]
MRIRRFTTTLVAGVLTIGLAGCTGAPDREDEARDIRDRVAAMPGVTDADLVYDNDVMAGTRFELRVDMDAATDDQIGAVADEMDHLRGDTFDDFDQRAEINVARWTTLAGGDHLPDDAARIAAQLRRLRADVQAESIVYFAGTAGPSIKVNGATATGRVVDTVLQVFTDPPPDTVEVASEPASDDPYWAVRSRMSIADKQRIDGQLAALAPAQPGYVTVRDGRIVTLTMSVTSPAAAHQEISGAVRVLDARPGRPVHLNWAAAGAAGARGPRWAGSAEIGGCDHGSHMGELLPDAQALQQRIRDEFGSC